jgi:hypothetical protein
MLRSDSPLRSFMVSRRKASVGACLAVALCLTCGCGRSQGKAESPPLTSSRPQASESVPIRSGQGAIIGRLRLIDPLPCYELRYEADYRLEDLSKPIASASVSWSQEAFACTCFAGHLANGHRLLGRNFDWNPDPALVLITHPKGAFASISLVDISYLGYSDAHKPFDAPEGLEGAWRIPFDGMNEKGFAVGMMAIDHAEGPTGTGKPKVGELGILRVLLDRAANVREAITLMDAFEVGFDAPPIHYLLTDQTGDAAVVEFLGGKLHVIRNDAPWMVSTNFLLSEVLPAARDSTCWRYAKVSARMKAAGGLPDVNGAIELLKAVSVPRTRWSAVYELESRQLTLALAQRFETTYGWSLD